MIGGVALVAAVALVLWLFGGRYVSTDDAYVQSAKLMVSTDVSGLVKDVDVKEGQHVKKGEVLFRLDPQPFRIAVQNAKAQLDQTALTIDSMKQDYQRMEADIRSQEAQVDLAQRNYNRYAKLLKANAISQSTYDTARVALSSARDQLAALQHTADTQLAKLGGSLDIPTNQHPQYLEALARVDEAQRQLDHSVVRAPFDGVVAEVDSLQPGTLVISAMSAFSTTSAVGLVATHDTWIEAHMKETDLTHVHQGDPVTFTVDTYPGPHLARPCRGRQRQHRLGLLGAAGRKRQRQLGQGRSAHSGQDRDRSQARRSGSARGHEHHRRHRYRPSPLVSPAARLMNAAELNAPHRSISNE